MAKNNKPRESDLPPHSIGAEGCYLGCLMLAGDDPAPWCNPLPQDAFFLDEHRKLHAVLVDLHSRGPVDLVIVREELQRRNVLDEIGGVAFLSKLVNSIPDPQNFRAYRGIVEDCYVSRQTIQFCEATIAQARMPSRGVPSTEVAMKAAERLMRLTQLAKSPGNRGIVSVSALSTHLTGRAPFPVDALPPIVRGFVMEVSGSTGTDTSCAALASMIVLAGAIGNRVAASVKRGWTEPAVLWGAIVNKSGTTKSAVLKAATRPIVEELKIQRAQYASAMEAYEAEKSCHAADLDRWKQERRKGIVSDPPVGPEAPVEHRLLVSDVTTEKLGGLLQDNPLGLLLVRDELAAWIGAFDRYSSGGKGSDAPAWLSFFDASSVVIDRKSAGTTIFVERAAVSVLGSIQPGTLKRVFGAAERESGLLARLLLVQPPDRPVVWTDTELSDAGAGAWDDLLRGLLEIQPGTDDNGKPRPRLIPLAADARAAFIAWHNAHGEDVAGTGSEDLAAHLSKLRGVCIRLALIFCCVDAATLLEPVGAISLEHLQRAMEIVNWFKGEAQRVYGGLVETGVDREVRHLVELIQRRGGRITPRELQRAGRSWPTAVDAERALHKLVMAGVAKWVHPVDTGPGRPSPSECVLVDPVDSADTDGIPEKSEQIANCVNGGTPKTTSVDTPDPGLGAPELIQLPDGTWVEREAA